MHLTVHNFVAQQCMQGAALAHHHPTTMLDMVQCHFLDASSLQCSGSFSVTRTAVLLAFPSRSAGIRNRHHWQTGSKSGMTTNRHDIVADAVDSGLLQRYLLPQLCLGDLLRFQCISTAFRQLVTRNVWRAAFVRAVPTSHPLARVQRGFRRAAIGFISTQRAIQKQNFTIACAADSGICCACKRDRP